MSTIAIIAALDRELAPLVSKWRSTRITDQGRIFNVFEHENAIAVAGGIGPQAVARAARIIVRHYKPQVLLSAGLAGGLIPSAKVGSVIVPAVVIDAANGTEYRCYSGEEILVTATEITGIASKQALADRFHATAVDMEAAAVAEIARQEQIAFRCVKAISDEVDFAMPPLNQFVDQQGRFQNARFTAWLAVHPQYWSATAALARNSKSASQALCKYLSKHVSNGFQSHLVDKIEGAELSQIKH
jgi:adenosylhomocysteine nucleosidase